MKASLALDISVPLWQDWHQGGKVKTPNDPREIEWSGQMSRISTFPSRRRVVAALAVAICMPGMVVSARAETSRGPVTNLPLPRYVSMKADEGWMRRGPGKTHRVDWVLRRQNVPLQVTAEYDVWRRVRDVDGVVGWMHFTLLSGVRTVIVTKDYTPLRSLPDIGAEPNAYAERGVIAHLGECGPDWCRIGVDGTRGWVLKSEVWGVDPEEIIE
jgi:SH3-like domain-containing protein